MLAQFMDFQVTDFSLVYPDIKPGIGGVRFFTWAQFNPARDSYNFQPIEDWLEAEAQIKLSDGSPKPLICFLFVHAAPKGDNGLDLSPDWVKAECPTRTLTVTIKDKPVSAVMPAYDMPKWWDYVTKAVLAFGQALDGKVAFMPISIGCDGELWPMKPPWNAQIAGTVVERMYGQEIPAIFDVYQNAFPHTKLIANSTPGSGHKSFTQTAIDMGIGYHMCGAQTGNQNAEGWGNEYGTWTGMVDAKKMGVPVVAETTSGLGDRVQTYWTILAMLGAGHIDAFDVHPDHLSRVTPEFWTWAIAHMGVTADTTPSCWCVLRDYDPRWPPREWTGFNGVKSGQSDWRGDFDFFMNMEGNAPRAVNLGPTDALEYPQCRQVYEATFTIDSGFKSPPYDVRIRWLQETAKSLTVEYFDENDELVTITTFSDCSGEWRDSWFVVKNRTFIVRGNSTAVHMVEATIHEEEEIPGPDMDVVWAALSAAEANLVGAESNLDAASTTLLGAETNVNNALSQLEDAKWNMDLANANVDSAKTLQVQAQSNVDACESELAKIRAELEKL